MGRGSLARLSSKLARAFTKASASLADSGRVSDGGGAGVGSSVGVKASDTMTWWACNWFWSITWVPEGNLAGLLGRNETALHLVRGADFSWKLMCGAGPSDLGGPGVGFGRESREDRPSQTAFRYPGHREQHCVLVWINEYAGAGLQGAFVAMLCGCTAHRF